MISERDRLRINTLWDRVADLGAKHTDEALHFVLSDLTQLLDAHYAWWMGALQLADVGENDPVSGWRPRAFYTLPDSPEREFVRKEHSRRIESGAIDQSVLANLNHRGDFRINILHKMVPESWFRSNYYETLYKPFEMRDAIYVITPLSDNVESWMVFERNGLDKPLYGDNARELLNYAIRPMKWFQRQLVLRYGVHLLDDPLTGAEKRVLNCLLTEKTEKEIADELQLSQATVHTYCTRIYRKYGVRGRAGLLALWLGKMLED